VIGLTEERNANHLRVFLLFNDADSLETICSVGDRMFHEIEAVVGMRIGRGKKSTWRNPILVPLRPLQIPNNSMNTEKNFGGMGRPP
jgi:hypothetical protein